MKARLPARIILHVVLMFGALTMILPFLWMISTSLKDISEVFIFPPTLFGKRLMWGNYLRISDRFPFFLYFLNSLEISAFVVLGQLATSASAGFVFARLRFRGREAIFTLYLATMMIPAQVTTIPNFLMMKTYGLVDTHASLILPALVTAFGTFLMRQFFLTIPKELEEAARIDGCPVFRIFWNIFLPLSKPSLATLGIFTFMGVWNDFLGPLIYLNTQSKMTLTLGLASMQGMYSTDWPVLMAGTFLSIIPVMIAFFAAQDLFIKGVTLSGLKES